MFEEISKFKAAEEELITSINLYFTGGTPVSIHTLARASHEVLDRICEYKNLERGIIHQGSTWIKPESKKEFFKKISEAKNFFKHADNDPDSDGKISWNPEVTQHYILDSILLYRRITGGKMPCEISSFLIWYRVTYPQFWDGSTTEVDNLISNAKDLLKDTDKKEVYKLLMGICRAGPLS